MARAGIEPFYFGTSGKPLFGCYHAPTPGLHRQCGVVLCPPMGREYIQSHRAYQQLAFRLAQAGFPVLRFDFYGCGDSSGDFEHAQLHQWRHDIETAIGEMRARGGVATVCLVGLRLGGTLALSVASQRGDVDSLALWDPIVTGKTYVQELIAMHQDIGDVSAPSGQCLSGEGDTEVLGFPLTERLRRELESVDLFAVEEQLSANTLLLVSDDMSPTKRLRDHLHSLGARAVYRHLPGPKIWRQEHDYSVFVSPQSLHAIVTWFAEVYA